jgi:hypothetical protein
MDRSSGVGIAFGKIPLGLTIYKLSFLVSLCD